MLESYVKSIASNAPSNALPRLLLLRTHAKNPTHRDKTSIAHYAMLDKRVVADDIRQRLVVLSSPPHPS